MSQIFFFFLIFQEFGQILPLEWYPMNLFWFFCCCCFLVFAFLLFCFAYLITLFFDGMLSTSCQEVQVPGHLTLGDWQSRWLGFKE